MGSISLGQVAALIAFSVFLVRTNIGLALVLLIASILRPEINAVTWSVASRALQASHWPTLLLSDSESTKKVPRRIVLLTWIILINTILLTVVGIVTPLGLSQVDRPSLVRQAQFVYAPDLSSFGQGTPPRYDRFSRRCGATWLTDCPGRQDGYAVEQGPTWIYGMNTTGRPGFTDPYFNTTIPANISKIFSSATNGAGDTRSGAFDIQYRAWVSVQDSGGYTNIDRGQPYTRGSLRSLENLIMRNGTILVEGLVVDMINGGIGFRNHTMPTAHGTRVSWKEDLTWVEPVTTCVNTNLTMEFFSGDGDLAYLKGQNVVDDGGFSNLQKGYPFEGLVASQNLNLYSHAYKGAVVHNQFVVRYLGNVKNSTLGQRFALPNFDNSSKLPTSLELRKITGYVVDAPYASTLNQTSDLTSPNHTLTVSDFEKINLLCEGSGYLEKAGMANAMVKCGMVLAPPVPRDPGLSPLFFHSNSTYIRNMHICASALRASIKTVTFVMNGTASLSNVKVQSVEDKKYSSLSGTPLWGVERVNRNISELRVLWGLVNSRYENDSSLDTLRRDHFWLPNSMSLASSPVAEDSLASAGAFASILETAYDIAPGSWTATKQEVYSGENAYGLHAMWQKLAASPETASRIVNLIATDLMASYLVSTKSAIIPPGSGSAEQKSNVLAMVEVFEPRIEYNLLYAIPALIALILLVVTLIIVSITCIKRRLSLRLLKQYLNQSSTGRTYTNVMHPDLCPTDASTKIWVKEAGSVMLTPLPQDESNNEYELKDRTPSAGSRIEVAERRMSQDESRQPLRADTDVDEVVADNHEQVEHPRP